MRKIMWFILGVTLYLAGPAAADSRALVREFAACAGRYSAQMEWRWLMSAEGADASAANRAYFVDLIDAVMPDALEDGVDPRDVLAWRIEAKHAQAKLMNVMTFSVEADVATPAAQSAAHYLSYCDAMLPSS